MLTFDSSASCSQKALAAVVPTGRFLVHISAPTIVILKFRFHEVAVWIEGYAGLSNSVAAVLWVREWTRK